MTDWKHGFYSDDEGYLVRWRSADDAESEAQLMGAQSWGVLLPLRELSPVASTTVDPAAFWAALQEHAPDVAKALAEAAPAPGHRTALADTGDHDYVCDICCQSGAEEHTLRACAVRAQEQLARLRDKLAEAAPRAGVTAVYPHKVHSREEEVIRDSTGEFVFWNAYLRELEKPLCDQLGDGEGADPSEWPEDLRVRELPEVSR